MPFLRSAFVADDGWTDYCLLAHEHVHNVVNHAEIYVKGNLHTNRIENFCSLLKRGLKEMYVSVELFHLLIYYLDEQAFRFNNQKDNDAGRFTKALVRRGWSAAHLYEAHRHGTTAWPSASELANTTSQRGYCDCQSYPALPRLYRRQRARPLWEESSSDWRLHSDCEGMETFEKEWAEVLRKGPFPFFHTTDFLA